LNLDVKILIRNRQKHIIGWRHDERGVSGNIDIEL
jgi:hypothetical protein